MRDILQERDPVFRLGPETVDEVLQERAALEAQDS